MSVKDNVRNAFVLGASVGLLVAVSTASAEGPATAADSVRAPGSAQAEGVLEEIVVTAQKREQSINDVPMSITAITGTQLANKGITDVEDLVKVIPGFNFIESDRGTPVYSLRGIGFYDSSNGAVPAVSIYVDQVPLDFAVMTKGAPLDLERVEVLKGPQGTLFGQNATGGAINYIAAKPTSTFQAGVSASYGAFNTTELNGFVSGPLSDTVSARIAIRSIEGGGWQKSITRDDTLGARDENYVRLLVDWKPSDALTVELNLNGWLDHSDTPALQFIGLVPQFPTLVPKAEAAAPFVPPGNDQLADWTPGVSYARDNSFSQQSVRIDYRVGNDVTLTSITAHAQFDDHHTQDPDGQAAETQQVTTDGFNNSLSQELRVSGPLGETANWVVGGNYSNDHVYQHDSIALDTSVSYSLDAFGPPFLDISQHTWERFENKAVFGNMDFDLAPNVVAHTGIRYTKTATTFSGCSADGGDGVAAADFSNLFNYLRGTVFRVPPIAPIQKGGCITVNGALTPGLVNSRLDESNVSWRIGVDWKPVTGSLLYANVSKGYKSGSFPILSASSDAEFAPVKQESVLAYELGFKSSLIDRSLQLDGAVFYDDYTDKQLKGRAVETPNLLGPLELLVNVPRSSIKGAELQLTWMPIYGLTMTGGATYLATEIKNNFQNYTVLGTPATLGGEPFPYTPKWHFVGDAEYKWNLMRQRKLDAFIGAGVTRSGETYAGFGELREFRIDAYTLLDLRAGVETEDGAWYAAAWAKNVTNEYYWTNTTYYADLIERSAGMPRTFGVSISYRYH